jgi:hypothetical protein
MPLVCVCDGSVTSTIHAEEDAEDAAWRIYCCEGLVAWAREQFADSEDAAKRAIDLDPDLGPAWLLYAYAVYRQGRHDEAMALLDSLARDPEVGAVARSSLRRSAHRRDRDQLHLSAGLGAGTDLTPFALVDAPVHATRGAFGVGVRLTLRSIDWRARDLAGFAGGLGVTGNATAGTWRFQLHGGAVGLVDDRMVPGVEGGLRVDVRPLQAIGVGGELGAGALLDEGIAYGHPVARLFLTVYAPGQKRY